MGPLSRGTIALLATTLFTCQTAARRNYIDDCPRSCSISDTPFDWIDYHSPGSLAACKEPMLLDFSLYNALNKTDSSWTMFACIPDDIESGNSNQRRAEDTLDYEETSVSLELASWGASTRASKDTDAMKSIVKSMQIWLGGSSKTTQFHVFGHFGKVTAGLYIGPRFDRSRTAEAIVNGLLDRLDSNTSPLIALQHCGDVGEDTIGLAISTNGDLNSIQRLIRQWREGECPSDHDETTNLEGISVAKAPPTIAIPGLHRRGPILRNRADACETKQVELGEDCPKLAQKCGISGDDFTKYNSYDKNLCSSLRAGQHVCCTSGDLPDFSPDPFENGTCYSHRVETGEDCSYLAAAHSLTEKDLETFNEDTWGWRGCGDLQASLNICLSKGKPPFPAPIAKAICGPQVENTTVPEDSSPAEWALLNPCPLNACCNLNGWCGINPEFCEYKESGTGNPGTGVCISNCGTSVVNDDIPPDEFANVGYFLASNLKRDCLTMNAYSIRGNEYTHIQFAFGNIKDDYSIGLMEGDEEQFEYFKGMTSVKRIISFGGWDFSTFPETYHIFRNGVKEENREKFAKNVVDFVEEHDLDGVDFDWEYPGAPDLPDIPVGEEEEGERYLEFLKVVREQLPDGKSLSIAAPASFWYLQAFPIDEIADVVDYIVYMTYDLRGQWDYDNNDPPLGCPDGNCLQSHVNSTETQYALAMITKAQVQTKKLMVGVSSYGRSFEMAEPGCTGPTCKYTGNGASKGRCTDTSGYLANAEINEILKNNGNAAHSYDEKSDSDILVYNESQWTAYMTDETRNRRIDKYSGMNMGGSVEWSIDLQKFVPPMAPAPGIFLPLPEDMDIDEFCAEPDLDKITEAEASAQRNISAYFDYFFEVRRGGDTSSWTQELFAGTETVSCDTYPDGPCGFPDPGECHGYEPPSLYWAQFAVANYFDHISKFGTMFRDTTFNESLNIGRLVADFPIKTPSDTTQSTLFGIFAGALGVASGMASGAGVGPPSNPGSVGGAAAGAVLAGFSGMWTILSAAVEDAEPPDEDDMERALNLQLGTIWNAAYRAGQNGVISLFEDGDLSDIPKEYKEGDYEYEISNFFDGRWLHRLTGKFVRDMQNALSENMRKSLASFALTFANYYVMKGGFDTDDCSDQTGGKVIDDVCYTLEYPGDGKPTVNPKRSVFSKTVSEDTLELMTDKYSIDLEELYKISDACQSKTGDYGGTIDSGTFKLFSDSEKPDCFYSLPVFVAAEDDDGRVSWRTPCWARVQNMTAGDDETPKVGETYLPPNLDKIIDQEFCVPCSANRPGCNIG